jgi:hypothetical protein
MTSRLITVTLINYAAALAVLYWINPPGPLTVYLNGGAIIAIFIAMLWSV